MMPMLLMSVMYGFILFYFIYFLIIVIVVCCFLIFTCPVTSFPDLLELNELQ